jgi:4-amino-4-deoxy-L-arabinose transferase-like glycosyltransferase
MMSVTLRDPVLLTFLTLVILIPGTVGVSFVDRDEGWYAQVSREMLASGDWVVPRMGGEPWLAKPPLLYWLVASAFAAFGMVEWAARLVSVLAMLGVVQLLATLGARLYTRRAAMMAAVSFVTMLTPVIVGRMLLTDALLLWWCMAAMVLLWGLAARGVTAGQAVAFWLCVGLAILAKGPAVVPFVGAFGVGLLTNRDWRGWLRSAKFWAALPVCLVVAAPWYVAVALQAPEAFREQFLGYEISQRFTAPPHGHAGPPGTYIIISLAGLLPWTPLVVGAIVERVQRRRVDPAAGLVLVWLVLPWVFLELVPSKLPHYVLPCYVPVAILLGRMWDEGLERAVTTGQRVVLGIWALVPMAGGLGLMWLASRFWQFPWGYPLAVAALVLMVGFFGVGLAAARAWLTTAWRGAVVVTLAFHVLVGVWLLPMMEPDRLSRNIATQANALDAGAEEVLVCGYTEPTVLFYLERAARVVGPAAVAEALRAAEQPVVVVMSDAAWVASGLTVDERRGMWRAVRGFNYVNGERATVWVAHVPAAEKSRE